MKRYPPNHLANAFYVIALATTPLSPSSAMKMSNLLMGKPLEAFLSDLVSFGDMSRRQMSVVMGMADGARGGYRTDVFVTESSRDELRNYLYGQVSEGEMDVEVVEDIASTLSLGGMYPGEFDEWGGASAAANMLDGPVEAVYDTSTEGNMARLGKNSVFTSVSTSQNGYNGIWGHSTGELSILMRYR